MDKAAIRFNQSARKHRISKSAALQVIHGYEQVDTFTENGTPLRWWVGEDE